MQFNKEQQEALQSLMDELHRKLALAKTGSSYSKGTSSAKKRATQINTLCELLGMSHRVQA